MVARHRNDILVVTDLEKVPYDDAVDRAASHSQAVSRLVEITAPSAFLEFMTAGKHPATLTDTIFSLSPIEIRPVTVGLAIHMHAKNSNGTTVGTFSIFNLLRGRFTIDNRDVSIINGFTLLPSFHSLPHYALLVQLMERL